MALVNMWLDTDGQHQGSSDILVKGLQDGPSLAGVVILYLLQSPSMPRRQRLALVRKLDGMEIMATVEKLFPSPARKEAFRLALGQLAGEAGLLCSSDSDVVSGSVGGSGPSPSPSPVPGGGMVEYCPDPVQDFQEERKPGVQHISSEQRQETTI